MPTITVDRDRLFREIGRGFSEAEFDELCFEFGLELDGVEENEGKVEYKVEVPANRYDLLCIEGLSQALRVFLNVQETPQYTLSDTPTTTMTVKRENLSYRPLIVCAILRDLSLDEESYQSLIDLQEKLHHNICRRRSLVAIGTHDLDSVTAPFSYEAVAPESMPFVALRQTDAMDGKTLLEHYKAEDPHLGQYVPMLENREHFPYVLDAKRTVMSMPPIINGEHSKISPSTRNMLIECTATDLTKASIVLNILIAMFSRYCAKKYHVETVKIEYDDGTSMVTPKFEEDVITTNINYINQLIGINIEGDQMINHLRRMQVNGKIEKDKIIVKVPVIRPDLLAPCDIMCDIAVGYGFNNIVERIPETNTVGKQQPLNHLSDLIRREFAQVGYTEVLTWVTVSHEENYDLLRRNDDGYAVKLGNPKTIEFQECRTSLLPGLLKTLRENRKSKVPIKLFEVGDVIVKNSQAEVGASNRRKIAAIFCSTMAGFEIIQGVLEHIMLSLGVKNWCIDETNCEDGAFFDGRKAAVMWGDKPIGSVGWIHPQVLTNFNLLYPCSAFEIDLENFL